MKAYTDLEQSKKLAEILQFESADMYYQYVLPKSDKIKHIPENGNPKEALEWYNKGYTHFGKEPLSLKEYCIPCWSLAALIDVLPADWWGYSEHYFLEISKMGDASKPNEVRYFRFRKDIDGANYGRITHISHSAENLVDACVAMIELLHELKIL